MSKEIMRIQKYSNVLELERGGSETMGSDESTQNVGQNDKVCLVMMMKERSPLL